MHEGELPLDDDLAARLIARRFPELGALPLKRVRTSGTVNTIIRAGDALVARFPLLGASEEELRGEAEAMTEYAAACPFAAPRSYGVARASADFASAWSVQTWLEGEVPDHEGHAASTELAHDLVTLITALRVIPKNGRVFDGNGRGGHLPDHDEWVAKCLAKSEHLLDTRRAAALWSSLRVLPTAGPDVMSHRDLTPFNLLVAERDGEDRLIGVLDTGSFGPADRALDLVAAWHLFDSPRRRIVSEGVGADDVEWLRGAGWAFQQAMGLVWYYEESNPPMSALGLSTMRRLLEDEELAVFTI
jgi:aminoglycoside phosphotransferase (APT) family kinase protein